MKHCLLPLLLLLAQCSFAQKREELLNAYFKPTANGAYYYVTTEKQDSLWFREAFYVSQRTMAMKGWYADSACKKPHGPQEMYHHNRYLKSKGEYINGKKEGVWIEFNEKGTLTDSTIYRNGRPVGISIGWHDNGYLRDSTHFDENGNGVQVSWYDDGGPASAGRLNADLEKTGRWKYFHRNGAVMATEDYSAPDKLATCLCYDETGVALDTVLCSEKEAVPSGGLTGWRRFLERNLLDLLQGKVNRREWGSGQLTVVVRFVVEKDGSLGEFTPLTAYGHGVEDDVIRFLKRAPKWTPGRQRGQVVRSYHTQPVSFMVQ